MVWIYTKNWRMLFPTIDKIEVRQVRLYVQYKISYGSRKVYKHKYISTHWLRRTSQWRFSVKNGFLKILQISQDNKKIPTQVLSFEYCQVFKNTCFEKHLLMAAASDLAPSEPQFLSWVCLMKGFQEQSSRDVFRKRCSENKQQIYRATPLAKCDFNKVLKQLYWNRTLVWVLCCKLNAYPQGKFL